MAVLGSRFGYKLLGVGLGIAVGVVVMTPPAFAQTPAVPPSSGVIDPYAAQAAPPAPPAPPPLVISAPPVPIPPPTNNQSGNGNSNNTNSNTVDPVITQTPTVTQDPTITANPTNTNTATNNANNTNDNKNDNRSNAENHNDNHSSATATNNNTIYIYPPTYTPPPTPPPVVAQSSISPPPLLPPPMLPPYSPNSPYYRPQRIRLNCQRLCAPPAQSLTSLYTPISPYAVRKPQEPFRAVAIGGHFTVMGMANQPLAGWGTLYGGGITLEFRSRGHFGLELSQDFLRGSLGNVNGTNFERKSYPFEFTLKGYILPNSDKHHFNMFFGGGLGMMPSNLNVPVGDGTVAHQDFLEWMVHGDVGAELRFKWLALGAEGRIDALYRDRSYGAGSLYGGVRDAPVPASTWGVEGRAYMKFWF